MASDPSKDRRFRPATELVHGGILRSQFSEMSEAMFLTQGFAYPSAEAAEARFNGEDPGFVYSRYANPTVSMFEERMCLLEGAEASRAVASGMAAVAAALISDLKAGDHILASRALFGSCLYIITDILGRYGVSYTLVDGKDLDAWAKGVTPETKVLFLETPSNPTLELVDIAGVAEIARKAGARLVVDNVFATPLYQRPLELGAHTVVYSATKHIDGQGRVLGGIVLSDEEWVEAKLAPYLKHTGPSMSAFNAWALVKALETMEVRVARQTDNAEKLAALLVDHPAVTRLYYPGHESHPQYELAKRQMKRGSTMIAFEVKNGKAGAFAVCNALEVAKISNNLGDSKSIMTHPATTTHQRLKPEERAMLGISDGVLRLSVGLEDVADLADDLLNALDRVAARRQAAE
ncbi:O-succinylhomoserine sulfhydrylase [Faunimonas pinastri]|uniref:O-succinylhomoserine sulfhydrylase n=1 Tax=Faunimonas pinastri TaxID=1855383 RepID=A0A1H9HMU8_9HYPH|nr:O-succinylhomoserine sulfhydrylase [Faunimonas pinastri]SEQ63640.1 O-succinylhomoserine sulfhydrylase [Faunimonas pinastri]